MSSFRHRLALCIALSFGAVPVVASAADPPTASAPAPAPRAGVAVLGEGDAREDAASAARAVYGSTLRPRALDEIRARVLAGDPPPSAASKELKDLAELRASVHGDDAASRRLLASIAEQIHVQAIVVVARVSVEAVEDAGGAGAETTDGGLAPPPPRTRAVAKLFLVDTGEFDAARYDADAGGGWQGLVRSLIPRFPPGPAPNAVVLQTTAPKLPSEGKDSRPFYVSPWFWGAVAAAVLVGGAIYFASQNSSDGPIRLQLHVPR